MKPNSLETKTMNMKLTQRIAPLLVGLALALPPVAQAQQLPQFSQRGLDLFYFNPAVAGSNFEHQVQIHHRSQWLGIEGAPISQMFSYNGAVGANSGLGGYVLNDSYGPSRGFWGGLAYARHFTLDGFNLSAGLGLNMTNFWIMGNQITLPQPDPLLLDKKFVSRWSPDLNLGMLAYNRTFFLGVSAYQLFQHSFREDYDIETSYDSYLKTYVSGGLLLGQHKPVMFKPNFTLGLAAGEPLELQVGGQFTFGQTFDLGLSYRFRDAAVVLLGLRFQDFMAIYYSYDLITSELSTVSSGSHELRIAFTFKKRENHPAYETDDIRNDLLW